MKIKLILYKLTGLFIILINLNSCGIYRPVSAKDYPPEPEKRIQKNLQEGRGFTLMGANKKGDGNFNFATSNEMWRASLDILDFMPLTSADYGGGLIITDWYNDGSNASDSVKISIRFLSNEIRADGLKVIIYKKICKKNDKSNCQTIQDNPKETGGTLLGAGLGALIGSNVGSGKGQLTAVALGALVGAWAGSEVGKSLDKADRVFAEKNAQESEGASETGLCLALLDSARPRSSRLQIVVPSSTTKNATIGLPKLITTSANGPPGVGKTAVVCAVATMLGAEARHAPPSHAHGRHGRRYAGRWDGRYARWSGRSHERP